MFDIKKMQQELQVQSINEIMECNEVTSNYGIVITQQQLPKINKEIHAYFYQCMEHIHSVIYHAIQMGKVEQIFL